MPRNQGRQQQQEQQQQQQQAAEHAARTLQTLLSSSSISQLLQQHLSARALTVAEAEDIAKCWEALSAIAQHLRAALSQQPNAAARHEVLPAVLQQQAAFSAGIFLSWVLQQPQQLQLSELQERFGDIYTPEALLLESSTLLNELIGALPRKDAGNTARTLLQQPVR
jgi:YesN/AraC family two-component response regulator